MFLRQSTASQEVMLGPFLNSTDGNTAETALTIANTDIKVFKHGAITEANKNSGGATHIASGRYYIVLDATDTDTLGNLEINVHVAGALPVRRQYTVLPAQVFDSIVLGTDTLDTTVVSNGDKTGYSLTQAFPSNFSAMSITAGGLVDITQAAADKAWSTTTRILTAGTNIVLAKGTGITGFNDLSSTNVSTAVWDAATASFGSAGSYGLLVEGLPTAAGIADAVWDEAIAGHLTAGSTGNALNAAGSAGDPWSTSLPGAYGAGTAGKIIGDNINATISSRATQTSVDTVDDFLDTEIAAIKAKTDNLPANPAATTDIPSATTIAGAVWDLTTTGHTTGGTFGAQAKTVIDNISGFIDTEVAAILAAVDTEVAAIKAKTDNLPANPAATTDIPSAATVAAAVWDLTTTGHTTVGTFGAQTKTVIDNISGFIDTEVAAILAAVDTEVAAIKAKTDQLTFTDTGKVDATLQAAVDVKAAVANKLADHMLRRNLGTALGSSDGDTKTFRSLAGATSKVVNRVTAVGTTLTVYETDDTTTLGTQTLTLDPAADPITAQDTV